MSNLTETKLTLRIPGGWETQNAWILADHHFVPSGHGNEPKVGDAVMLDEATHKWALRPPVPVPFTPPEEPEPVVRTFTAQGYEYSYPQAFPAQVALALDIRDLLLDIRAGRTTGNPHNAFKP
jgi:hypothetical protein